MDERKDDKIMKEFEFFGTPDPTMKKNLLGFGLECGNGWFNLIWELCEDLKKLKFRGKVLQLKEKFGGMRFYINGDYTKEQLGRIIKAEDDSYFICEDCGSSGKLRKRDKEDKKLVRIKTLCEKCMEKLV